MTTETRGRSPAACRRFAIQRAMDVTRPPPGAGASTCCRLVSGERMSVGPFLVLRHGVGGPDAHVEDLVQPADQRGGALRLHVGEVGVLAGIAREVEEHPLAAGRGDELVVAV